MKKLLVLGSVLLLVVLGLAITLWRVSRPGAFESEIADYEKSDRIHPPRPGCIVFTGSSSIRLWDTLAEDMKPLDAINGGFGGSQLSEVNRYASRIVIPYRPRAVVVYAGENDMAWPVSKSPETVLADFQRFVRVIHSALPDTWIYYISVKPDPLRWGKWPVMQRANKMIAEYSRTQNMVQFIDVSSAMLDEHGQPRGELFRLDGLHMNAQGYALWTSIIRPVLLNRFGAGAAAAD